MAFHYGLATRPSLLHTADLVFNLEESGGRKPKQLAFTFLPEASAQVSHFASSYGLTSHVELMLTCKDVLKQRLRLGDQKLDRLPHFLGRDQVL